MIKEAPFKKHWLLGHTKHFAKDTLGFVLSCTALNMPMAKAKIAFKNFIFLLDHEAIIYVLQKNNKNYHKSFAYNGLKEFLGKGLLTAEGENWLKNRRIMQPSFHKSAIESMEIDMAVVVQNKILGLKTDKPIDLQALFLEWTRDILVKSFFALEPGQIKGQENMHEHLWTLRNYANERMKNPFMLSSKWPTKTNKKFKIAYKELELIILDIFRKSAAQKEQGTLLQAFLEQLKQDKWNDQQIFDEIITLFLAGQETTTNALMFLVHCLAKYPETLNKIYDPENALSWKEVIHEVLRLYPPAWAVSRLALENDQILGEKIAQGDTVFLSIFAMQRHPNLWQNPNAFVPERFLGNYPKHAYMPFGIGQRLCIGNHFALLEMEIIAKSLYENFVITPLKQEIQLITPITLGIKNGLSASFRRI